MPRYFEDAISQRSTPTSIVRVNRATPTVHERLTLTGVVSANSELRGRGNRGLSFLYDLDSHLHNAKHAVKRYNEQDLL